MKNDQTHPYIMILITFFLPFYSYILIFNTPIYSTMYVYATNQKDTFDTSSLKPWNQKKPPTRIIAGRLSEAMNKDEDLIELVFALFFPLCGLFTLLAPP